MSASRQIAFVVIILVAAAVGWFGYERGWYGHAPDTAPAQQQASAQNAAGAGQQGNRQRQGGGAGGAGGAFGRGGPVIVVTAPVDTDTSGIEVQAVGTVASAQAVTLYPQVTGVVTEIAFTPGSKVTAGQPLVRLDDSDAQVALDKAQLAVASAQAAYDRASQLAQSNNATTVAVSDAKNALDTAQINLKSAQLDLAKRTIAAPFAGTVGDLVSSQKAIVTLDDTSTVIVSFSVPERASGLVKAGDSISATTDALAGQKFSGKVIAVDSRVDPATRALNVQASVPNEAAALKPGMALTLVLDFPGTAHPSVPSLSIQWDRQGSYVWKVADGKATRVPVQIITRRSGVVTVAGDLNKGDPVVTEGVLRVREGAQVAEAGAAGNGGANGGQGNRPNTERAPTAESGASAAAKPAAAGG
jgi:RND family efflux transporter MFP subunit